MSRKINLKNAIFIFCEGETEEQYFECLKSKSRIPIHILTIWEANISNTKRQINKIWNHLKIKYLINKRDVKKYGIRVCYTVDTDTIANIQDIMNIKQNFKKGGIDIFFSNRNWELFILEHYEYYNKESQNYINEIKKFELEYEKGKSLNTKRIFESIIENNIEIMKRNLKKLKKFHESNGRTNIYDMNPYSEIIDLVEYIESVSRES